MSQRVRLGNNAILCFFFPQRQYIFLGQYSHCLHFSSFLLFLRWCKLKMSHCLACQPVHLVSSFLSLLSLSSGPKTMRVLDFFTFFLLPPKHFLPRILLHFNVYPQQNAIILFYSSPNVYISVQTQTTLKQLFSSWDNSCMNHFAHSDLILNINSAFCFY